MEQIVAERNKSDVAGRENSCRVRSSETFPMQKTINPAETNEILLIVSQKATPKKAIFRPGNVDPKQEFKENSNLFIFFKREPLLNPGAAKRHLLYLFYVVS